MRSWLASTCLVVGTSLLGGASCGAPVSKPADVALPTQEGEERGAPVRAEALPPEALLARLPRDAAVYAAVRPAGFDAPLAPLLARALRDAEVGALFGEARSLEALLEGLGVDPTRPILFATSASRGGDGKALVDLLASDARWEDLAPRVEAMAPMASTYRLVLPLGPDGGGLAGLQALFGRFDLASARCPADARCKAFGAEQPRLLVHRAPWIGAVFVDGASAELELARTRSWNAENEPTWTLLASAREAARGGPQAGRCAAVDLESAAWMCVDADRLAAQGTAEGNLSIASALSGVGFEPGERARIAVVGRQEVARITQLARPSRMLLDAGTSSLRFSGMDYTLDARWRVTDASREGVARALNTPHCAPMDAPAPLAEALRGAFADPGPDWPDPVVARQHLAEAGLAGHGIAFARTWPNLRAFGPADLRALSRDLGATEACASHESGTLRVTLRGRAPWGSASPTESR